MRLSQFSPIFVAVLACAVLSANPAFADDTDDAKSARKAMKGKLADMLSAGDIKAGNFDSAAELDIAKLEMQLVDAYLTQGDRKNAVIHAVLARKAMQRVYNNPKDPQLIPVYSLLVKVYQSGVDMDAPGTDASEAAKAKAYRDLILQIKS